MDSKIKEELVDEIQQLNIKKEEEDLLKMTKEISVNGIHVIVDEDKSDDICKLLREKDLEVDDRLGDWKSKSTFTHEPYDFNEFIKKAKDCSDQDPPDLDQFGENAWGAASICVKEFYVKRLGILIKSHKANSELVRAACTGLSGEQAIEVAYAWNEAKDSHSNFYEMNLVEKRNREALLGKIKKMAEVIEKADLKVVGPKLDSLKSVTLLEVHEGRCKIGSESYKYTRIAY